VATVEQCELALHGLAAQLAERGRSAGNLDRTLSAHLSDLGVAFAGRLHDGLLDSIRQLPDGAPPGQIKLTMSSDDLVRVVAGELNLAGAWASGKVKVDASMLDLLKLRSFF
jgi:hypothetical protein